MHKSCFCHEHKVPALSALSFLLQFAAFTSADLLFLKCFNSGDHGGLLNEAIRYFPNLLQVTVITQMASNDKELEALI